MLSPIRAEVATQSHHGHLHQSNGYELPVDGGFIQSLITFLLSLDCLNDIACEYTATVVGVILFRNTFRVQLYSQEISGHSFRVQVDTGTVLPHRAVKF